MAKCFVCVLVFSVWAGPYRKAIKSCQFYVRLCSDCFAIIVIRYSRHSISPQHECDLFSLFTTQKQIDLLLNFIAWIEWFSLWFWNRIDEGVLFRTRLQFIHRNKMSFRPNKRSTYLLRSRNIGLECIGNIFCHLSWLTHQNDELMIRMFSELMSRIPLFRIRLVMR